MLAFTRRSAASPLHRSASLRRRDSALVILCRSLYDYRQPLHLTYSSPVIVLRQHLGATYGLSVLHQKLTASLKLMKV